MESVAIIAVIIAALTATLLWVGLPRPYASRNCMGRQWHSTFPDTPKADIRKFLLLFTDAFAFQEKHKLAFAPSDRIIDIYLATIGKWGVDALEVETLADDLEQTYRFDLEKVWDDQLTLGQLFELVSASQYCVVVEVPRDELQ